MLRLKAGTTTCSFPLGFCLGHGHRPETWPHRVGPTPVASTPNSLLLPNTCDASSGLLPAPSKPTHQKQGSRQAAETGEAHKAPINTFWSRDRVCLLLWASLRSPQTTGNISVSSVYVPRASAKGTQAKGVRQGRGACLLCSLSLQLSSQHLLPGVLPQRPVY